MPVEHGSADLIHEEFPSLSSRPNIDLVAPLEELEIDSSTSEPEKKRRFNPRKLGATVLSSLVIVTGAIGIASEAYAGDVAAFPKVAIEYVDHHEAPEVSFVEQQRMDRILDRPENPEVVNMRQVLQKETPSEQQMHNFYTAQAEKYGFHLANTAACSEKLKKAKSQEQVLEAINELADQYGFSVSLLENSGIPETGLGIKAVDKDNLKLDDLKYTAQSIIWGLELVPVELAKKTDLNSVKIVNDIQDGHSGFSNPVTKTIYVRIGADTRVMAHELGHQIDGQTNGLRGMLNDPGFSKLNPEGFKYGDFSQPVNSLKTAVVEKYGFTDISEDKATYYGMILMSWGPDVYKVPIVKKKTAYLLAELDKLAPGAAAYYDSISSKSE